jgi:hypothetical protein
MATSNKSIDVYTSAKSVYFQKYGSSASSSDAAEVGQIPGD